MSTKMLVTMKLDQRLMMSQQLKQAITLLQYNTLELKQFIQMYIDSNPLIEVEEEVVEADQETQEREKEENEMNADENHYSANFAKNNAQYTGDNDNFFENYSTPKGLREHLLEQTLLCKFDAVQQIIAEVIIDAIDEAGYLTMSVEDIYHMLADIQLVTVERVLGVLKKMQQLEPVGIAARNLRECLLIQLNYLSHKDAIWHLAYKMIDEFLEMLAANNTKKLLHHLGITLDEFNQAMLLIRSLNPQPGMLYSIDVPVKAEPELYVKKINHVWQVFLSDSILTNAKINSHYQHLIKENRKDHSYHSLKQELQEATWLLKGLKRRNETLLRVGIHIMELQKDFLDRGHTYMKPLNMAEVALALNLHESTISRITSGKYIETPFGVFELKYFFPSSIATQSGENFSAIAVKSLMKEILQKETDAHILSDEELTHQLKQKGICIARRTVAKYREEMKILPSYQRTHQQLKLKRMII